MGSRLLLLLFMLVFAKISFAENINVETIVQDVCVACHAKDGNSPITANPKLAGQHSSYLYKQLMEFKSGKRDNAVMAGIASALSDEEMKALSVYFSDQVLKLGKASTNGEGSLGEKIFRSGLAEKNVPACAGCHGPAGHGIPSKFPRLNSQHADYIHSQLVQFAEGKRANDEAKVMRTIAQKLSQEEMKAVADYIQGLQ
jgi:cytochrome c553